MRKEKVMTKLSTFTTAGMIAAALAGTAAAQAPTPGGTTPAQRTAPPTSTPAPSGGMMGGDMGRMTPEMMQRRMAALAMQPFRRVEGQLAYFRAELRITDAQAQTWNAFADVVRAQAERLRQATQQAMTSTAEPGPATQQMEHRIALLSKHLEAMRAILAATTPLYAALSEEQRRTADELMSDHFRRMRMGMGMP